MKKRVLKDQFANYGTNLLCSCLRVHSYWHVCFNSTIYVLMITSVLCACVDVSEYLIRKNHNLVDGLISECLMESWICY